MKGKSVKKTLPPREEWAFSNEDKLKECELEACYLYEYSREVIKNNPTLSALHDDLSCEEGDLRPIMFKIAIQLGAPNQFPLVIPKMLSVPWQKLSIQEKKRGVVLAGGHHAIAEETKKQPGKKIKSDSSTPNPLTSPACKHTLLSSEEFLSMELPEDGESALAEVAEMEMGFEGWKPVPAKTTQQSLRFMFNALYPLTERGESISNIRFGLFAVDLDYPHETIVEGFKKWLCSYKKPGESSEKDPRKKNARAKKLRKKLKNLGVKRLIETGKPAELLQKIKEKQLEPPYAHLPSWHNALKSFDKENLPEFLGKCQIIK